MAEGDVVIRLRDVWDVATRTEGKVDLVVLAVADMRDKTLPDHEVRIRTVEKRLYALPSIATLIAAAALVVAILGLTQGSPSVAGSRQTPSPATAAHSVVTTSVAVVPTSAPATAPATTQARSVPVSTVPHRPPVTSPVVVAPPVTTPRPVLTLAQALGRLPSTLERVAGL